jgi:multidrug resistance efflux pump
VNPLPVIPTPPALRWREFRIRVLPVFVFVAGVAASVWIWTQHLAAPTLVGEVEVRRAHVTSTLPGRVTRLNVDRFAEVRAGEVIAEVFVCEPAYLESSIGVVKAESEVLRLQLDPLVTVERIKVDVERLRLDLLDQKVLLASTQVQLRYAESEHDRLAALHADGSGLVSTSDLEVALRDRDALRADVQSRAELVKQIELNLATLRASRPLVQDSPLPEGWRVALDLQEQRLRQVLAEFGPISLPAPIDGTVSTVYRRSGENVAAGEPIVTITATRSDRIVAYLLPPWRTEPEVGMAVEVRSRSGNRPAGVGHITHVGRHLDLITSSIGATASLRPGNFAAQPLVPSPSQTVQMLPTGLPLAISVPEGLHLVPGESVDLLFPRGQ